MEGTTGNIGNYENHENCSDKSHPAHYTSSSSLEDPYSIFPNLRVLNLQLLGAARQALMFCRKLNAARIQCEELAYETAYLDFTQ